MTAPIQPPSGVTATPQPAPTVTVSTQPSSGVTGTQPPPRVTVPIQPPSGVTATTQPAPTAAPPTPPLPVTAVDKTKDAKCKLITKIAICILGALIGATALTIGALAIAGVKLAFGPQFLIQAYEVIQTSTFAPYLLITGGGVVVVGLVSLATYLGCKKRKPHSSGHF